MTVNLHHDIAELTPLLQSETSSRVIMRGPPCQSSVSYS